MSQQHDRIMQIRPWLHCVLFLFSVAVLVTRRPDAVFHAQFWAEDGHVFFADAHNLGWGHAMFHTNVGYFHAVPRIGAALALLVPLASAPLVLNLIAIAIQALPVNLLLSARSAAWGSLNYRALLAATYLALPNSREISAIITNAQSPLVLAAFLLLVATVPHSRTGRVFELIFLLLAGLSGPYCIFLAPIALWLAWKKRERWAWITAAALGLCCLVQAWGLLVLSPTARSTHMPLGASASGFAEIIGGHIYLGAILGGNGLASSPTAPLAVFLILVSIGGSAFVAFCLFRTGVEMKLFILFSSVVFCASLISPMVSPHPDMTIWEVLAGGSGIHYWFFPMLAFVWSLLWCVRSRIFVARAIALVPLCLMLFGIIRDWQYPAFQDLHYAEYVRQYEASPAGSTIEIPLNPVGWEMRLIKNTSN
jgi:hypothetical protein